MKINQLFVKKVDTDLLQSMLPCFGLRSLEDKRTFCKLDLEKIETVNKLAELLPALSIHYLPCKARIYLENMSERKAITVLKQVLRLHGYTLRSKEKNFHNKKVMFYTLITEDEKQAVLHMTQMPHVTVTFS
jgi:hypothetical protein